MTDRSKKKLVFTGRNAWDGAKRSLWYIIFFCFFVFMGGFLAEGLKIARFPPTFLPNDSMAENSITSL